MTTTAGDNASVKKHGMQPAGAHGPASRTCVICRRAIAMDDAAIDILGLTCHCRLCGPPATARTPLMQRILVCDDDGRTCARCAS